MYVGINYVYNAKRHARSEFDDKVSYNVVISVKHVIPDGNSFVSVVKSSSTAILILLYKQAHVFIGVRFNNT